MPSHKTLKSVVYSMAHSLTSPYTYDGEDYVLGHILRSAYKTGQGELVLNLITGSATPESLVPPPVAKYVNSYCGNFAALVRKSKSSMDFIQKATLYVRFDIDKKTSKGKCQSVEIYESPYVSRAVILDNRGKEYIHTVTGLWAPSPPTPLMSAADRIVNAFKRTKYKLIYRIVRLFKKEA